jgi:DNA invertase Pin-like site-specific DNA recombinase
MLGIYSRISRLKEDGKDRSITDQKKLGEKKAKDLNLPYKHYVDEGITAAGESLNERPAIQSLLEDIISKQITAVFVIDESRLSRNPRTKYIITDIFKDYNIITHSLLDGVIDYSNPDDEFISEIKGVIHKRQVTEQKIKIKSVLKRNADEGKAHGILAYGYSKDENSKIIIDKDESDIVKRIYKMSLSGVGTNKIAEILNSENIPTRYNKIASGKLTTKDSNSGRTRTVEKKDIKWAGNTVRNIIKNTSYKGFRKFGGSVYKIPIIIEPEFWMKVNQNLSLNRNNSGKKVNHKYLLKGKIICVKCGRNYYGRTRTNLKDNYYMCSSKRYKDENCGNRSININVIENLIWNRFFEQSYLFDKINNFYQESKNEVVVEKKNNELININKDIEKVKNLRKNAVQLAINGTLAEEDVKPEIKKYDILKRDLEIKHNNLKLELEALLNAEEIIENSKIEFGSFSDDTPHNIKKEIIDKYIKFIGVIFLDGLYTIGIIFKTPELSVEVIQVEPNYILGYETVSQNYFPLTDYFHEETKINKSKGKFKNIYNGIFKVASWIDEICENVQK